MIFFHKYVSAYTKWVVVGLFLMGLMIIPDVHADSVGVEAAEFKLNVSGEFQPDFENPRKYSRKEMNQLAQEVLPKIEKILNAPFNRKDPQHVWALAEFFGLTPKDALDIYSTPMEEADVRYFSEVNQFKDKELYPQNSEELVIRFYWEGLSRIAAQHYQLEVVNNKAARDFKKSRGKVSDIATTTMFYKRPGISTEEAVSEGKERYDFKHLIHHLKEKGLSVNKSSNKNQVKEN